MHRVLARYDTAAPTDFYEVGLATPAGGAAYDMPRHHGFVHDGAEEAMALIPLPTCSLPAVMHAYRELVQWLIGERSSDPSHSQHRIVTRTWVDQRLSLVRSGCP